MKGENEVYDALFESLKDEETGPTFDLYPANPKQLRFQSALFMNIDGECWRVSVTPHLHEDVTDG